MKKLLIVLVLIILGIFPQFLYAADARITELTAKSEALASGDLIEYVDASDNAMGPDGTNKKMSILELLYGVDETYGSGWNGDVDSPEKDDIYDYLHLFDTDDDGKVNVLDMGAGLVKTDSGGVVSAASAGTDYSVPSGSETLTNKTIDAEGTGNTLTIPTKIWVAAAGCNNTTATPLWDMPTANAPASACITGTNTQKAVLDFDAATDESIQMHVMLPSDFSASGNLDLAIKWLAAATSGSVVWGVQTSCVADAETDDPSWNTASTVTDAAKGTTLQTNDASISNVTKTGCAAGELLHLRFYRNASNGSDDMTGDARLIGVEITYRRAM